MCPPKNSDSLDTLCTYHGKYANCENKPSIPGTTLIPKCKSTHYFRSGILEPSIELQCDSNGTWIGGEMYTCQPSNYFSNINKNQ